MYLLFEVFVQACPMKSAFGQGAPSLITPLSTFPVQTYARSHLMPVAQMR